MDLIKLIYLSTLLTTFFISCQPDVDSANAPDSFQIPDGFQLQLIASEPLVSDPVDMEIDEHGTMMVVEMHGYPLDLSGSGVVKQLIDTNDDGLPDRSLVFAENLVLPTGIMKWKNGWLVTDPPHVLYLEDTNQDGSADIRDTILVGFARSNPQHNVNSPTFGLDNWIYLSHEGSISTKLFDDLLGDEGEQVQYADRADGPVLPRNADGLAVRFNPDTGQLESLSSRGQFGQAFDDWGHHFLTSNADHLYHKVLDAKYVKRNKDLLISTSRHYMPRSGKGFEIYPITTSPEHQLLTDIGVITSACGILWYNGGLFTKEYSNTIFTAEPVHNLIHVDKIYDDGATFYSQNVLKEREFIASTDSWFRPVNHYIGPDGAIYVLDYYRKIIEHPEWLSDDITQSDDLTAGTDKGRIYRLSPMGTQAMEFIDEVPLGSYSVDQLIETLGHKNSWWRTHAQRLLMDDKEAVSFDQVKEFIRQTNSPQGKVHAAWLLEGLQHMDPNIISLLLNDSNPGVRENGLKIAEKYLDSNPELLESMLALVDDKDAKVRFQLLLSLGNTNQEEIVQTRHSLLLNDINDPWVHLAALTAKDIDMESLFTLVSTELLNSESSESADLFQRLSHLIISTGSDAEINLFISKVFSLNNEPWYKLVVLKGTSEALQAKGNFRLSKKNQQLLIQTLSNETKETSREALINLIASTDYFKSDQNVLVQNAVSLLKAGNSQDEPAVFESVNIISKSRSENHTKLLIDAFTSNISSRIRLACLNAFNKTDDLKVAQLYRSQWGDFSIEERQEAIMFFLKNDKNRKLLLDFIQDGSINKSGLSWPQTVSLLNSSNPKIRPLARSLLEGSQLKADEVWTHYEPCLSMDGKAEIGANVFKVNCGICHQLGNKHGIAFGPDLAPAQNRNKAALLLDIIQPNRSIADGFEIWTADLISGSQVVGVISEEGPTTVTIRNASGKDHVIRRNEIEALTASEVSAMPEGLHAQMSVEEMADLLAFLKKV